MTTKRRQLRERIQEILDTYGVLCTLQQKEPLCDALADAAIAVLKPQPRKKKNPPKKNRDMYHLAKSLAEVCNIDYGANQGRLFAEAKRLAKATPTPTSELVTLHYSIGGTWYERDWRGKQGNRPTLGQVRLTWVQLVGEDEQEKQVVIRVGR
jgi:hypothetical protein